jgi:hypothetical protein
MRFGFAIVALAATSASSAFVAPTRKKHTTFIRSVTVAGSVHSISKDDMRHYVVVYFA